MTIPLPIEFEQVAGLAEQLPEAEQKRLIAHLLTYRAQQQALTVEEKMQILRAAQIRREVNQQPSTRREDWYGEDGR